MVVSANARWTSPQETMRHAKNVWTEPDNADYPLAKLYDLYETHLGNRSKPVQAGTIVTYLSRLACFQRSLELHSEPLVLASVTQANVEQWIADMRKGNLGATFTEETISQSVSAIKTFTRKFIYRHYDLTERDLLDRVERFAAPVRVEEGFTPEELEEILAVGKDSDKYTDIRDRALMHFFAASGLRFEEVVLLEVGQVDMYSGRVRTIGKGDKEREVMIGERALKALKRYLRVRRTIDAGPALWTSDGGKPVTYDTGQQIFKRFKTKVNVPNIHPHRFRHTWAQTALKKGAERQLVQDQMGWASDQMLRRYSGFVRGRIAADLMPKYAPI